MAFEDPLLLAAAVIVTAVHGNAVQLTVAGLGAHYLGRYLSGTVGYRVTAVLLQIAASVMFGLVAFGFLLIWAVYGDALFLPGALVLGVPFAWSVSACISAIFRLPDDPDIAEPPSF